MESEWNLSDALDLGTPGETIYEQDLNCVREFIKKLKEASSNAQCSGEYCNANLTMIEEIDKLAGEKLC